MGDAHIEGDRNQIGDISSAAFSEYPIEELIKESDAHFQHKLFTAHVGYLQVTDETNGQDGEDCHDEPGHHH